jgi:hypothetical protein
MEELMKKHKTMTKEEAYEKAKGSALNQFFKNLSDIL